MKAVFDIKATVMLLFPILLIILDFLLVPSLVPTVTTDRIVNWVASFRKAEETFVLGKSTIQDVDIKLDPFKLKKETEKVTSPPRPVTTRKRTAPEKTWQLSMVIIGPRKRLALLNGILVTEGSVVDGYIVKEISRNYILLLHDKEVKKVFLKKGG